MKIRYLQQHQIDCTRWNACIERSLAPKAYALSQCLNALSKWDALVLGDYEAVWPLPWKQKWGIKYIWQPPFLQQLGLFSSKAEHYENCSIWLRSIPRSFFLADMQLNQRMQCKHMNGIANERNNFLLALNQPYEEIRSGYDNRHRSRLNKIERENLLKLNAHPLSAAEAVDFFSRYQGRLDPRLDIHFYKSITQLMVRSPELFEIHSCWLEKELCGIAILLKDEHRLYLIMSSPNKIGRHLNSQLFILDQVIRKYSQKGTHMLDFEGSDIPDVAHFYAKFGAEKEAYKEIRWRNPLLKLMRCKK